VTEHDLAVLLRWEDAGGAWYLEERGQDSATVVLTTCDGGQEMSRLTSSAPELLAYLRGRRSSEAGRKGAPDG
jgi:hypothetical protein